MFYTINSISLNKYFATLNWIFWEFKHQNLQSFYFQQWLEIFRIFIIIYPFFISLQFPVFSNRSAQSNGGSVPENGLTAAVDVKESVSNLPNHIEKITPAGQDLLRRLFERNPRHRLKSVRELERIAMFHQFSFDNCRERKLKPSKFIVVP